MPYRAINHRFHGFTLAELLIALAILGVIATFTIPKILSTQQNATYNSITKEAASTVAGALARYKQSNPVSSTMNIQDLTPYMNYADVVTSVGMDNLYTTTGAWTCGTIGCLRLHNGAVLMYILDDSFGGTATTNAVRFMIDPNGRLDSSSTTDIPGKSLQFYLYTNGRVTDDGNVYPGTMTNWAGSDVSRGASPSRVPPWFSW
jgi:prepilin-type N-terminal cleavage/methylation domain-containing protein